MKRLPQRILVYGDSNSWGFPPDGSGQRFDEHTRWPCVMAKQLGATLIEEALPGRTTALDDPELAGQAMNGFRHLAGAMLSHLPLDRLIIMLGTNDLKSRFGSDAEIIAANIGRLLDCIDAHCAADWSWAPGAAPSVFVIVPPPLAAMVEHPEYERKAEWTGGYQASLGMARAIGDMAARRNIPVFDAGLVVAASPLDPIHLDADSHIVLGRAVAAWLKKSDEDAKNGQFTG